MKVKKYLNSAYLNDTSDQEDIENNKILELFTNCPIPREQLLSSLGLFINRQTFSRMMFFYNIYQKYLLNSFGNIIEFGTRWGQNLALLSNIRGMLEPYNYTRKIVGFDTFEGLTEIDLKDLKIKENEDIAKERNYSTTKGYNEYLEKIMEYHETQSPLQHKKKYEIIKGDASVELQKYLNNNPETIISFAFFDMDIYKPTKKCLELILPHLHKGSVIAFDELNSKAFPGETIAFREVFGNSVKINHDVHNPMPSWIVF